MHPERVKISTPLHLGARAKASHQDMKEDNPLLARGIDATHVTLDAFEFALPSQVSRAANGLLAVAAASWGVSKLKNAESNLDRMEGVGSLALAAHAAAEAAHLEMGPLAHDGLELLHGGAELTLGFADFRQGQLDHCRTRMAAGICQGAVGAAIVASTFVPGTTPVAHGLALAAMVARQAILLT